MRGGFRQGHIPGAWRTATTSGVAATVVLLTAACSGDSAAPPEPTQSPSPTGTVSGGIYLIGGPSPGVHARRDGFQAGTVSVLDRGNVVAATSVPRGRRFSFLLRPGLYVLRVDDQAQTCRSFVHVYAGRTTQKNIVCASP